MSTQLQPTLAWPRSLLRVRQTLGVLTAPIKAGGYALKAEEYLKAATRKDPGDVLTLTQYGSMLH